MKQGWGVVCGLSVLCLAAAALAEPTADQVLTDEGLSAEDKQNHEWAIRQRQRQRSLGAGSLLRRRLPGQDAPGDPRQADRGRGVDHRRYSGQDLRRAERRRGPADLAKLILTSDEAKVLANAKAGDVLNLSASEIAAFKATGGAAPAVQEQLRRMLLARYQAYRATGLAGIAPYDRGGGHASDLVGMRKASQATQGLQKYLPAFQKVLLDYPKATLPGMREKFFWLKSLIQGEMTYVLAHVLVASDGAARVVVRREYYVSTGYNGAQTVEGFLPVQGGTVAVSNVHAFTDQVTGFGGGMKRGVGSHVMAGRMKDMYEAARQKSQQQR